MNECTFFAYVLRSHEFQFETEFDIYEVYIWQKCFNTTQREKYKKKTV